MVSFDQLEVESTVTHLDQRRLGGVVNDRTTGDNNTPTAATGPTAVIRVVVQEAGVVHIKGLQVTDGVLEGLPTLEMNFGWFAENEGLSNSLGLKRSPANCVRVSEGIGASLLLNGHGTSSERLKGGAVVSGDPRVDENITVHLTGVEHDHFAGGALNPEFGFDEGICGDDGGDSPRDGWNEGKFDVVLDINRRYC